MTINIKDTIEFLDNYLRELQKKCDTCKFKKVGISPCVVAWSCSMVFANGVEYKREAIEIVIDILKKEGKNNVG